MPYWRVVIEKEFQSQRWDNTWYITAGTLAGAVGYAESLVAYERQIHTVPVKFNRYSLSTKAVDGRNPYIVPLNVYGERTMNNQEGVPLILCFDQILGLNAQGEPGRKYFHGHYRKQDMVDNEFTGAFLTEMQEKSEELLYPMLESGLVLTGGEKVVRSTSGVPTVGYHQFKSSRKGQTST